MSGVAADLFVHDVALARRPHGPGRARAGRAHRRRSARRSRCRKARRGSTVAARLLAPPFVDALPPRRDPLRRPAAGQPNGTLLEGIALWGELKPLLTQEALVDRALAYCDWAVAKGLLAIRSHVDVCDDRLLAVEALLRARPGTAVSGSVARRLSAGWRAARAQCFANLKRALDLGVGSSAASRTSSALLPTVRRACASCANSRRRARPARDMHCDESDDQPAATSRRSPPRRCASGLQGRVTGSHLTSMHSMDNYYVSSCCR